MDAQKPEKFYKRLKAQLTETSSWPSKYLYKFIVPTDEQKIKSIETIFAGTGAIIESRQSKKGRYTSVSIKLTLESPDAVIEKYKEVAKVEGVISL